MGCRRHRGLRKLEAPDLGVEQAHGTASGEVRGSDQAGVPRREQEQSRWRASQVLPRIPSLRAALLYDNSFGADPGPTSPSFRCSSPYLDRNKLEGALPGERHREDAQEFHASFNKISGEIPKDIGRLPRLASLQLRRNQLVGEIPRARRLPELARLDLSENKLSGRIPAALANATDLAEIRLGVNELTGPSRTSSNPRAPPRARREQQQTHRPIPPWLGTHPCLRDSDLSGNGSTGGSRRRSGIPTATTAGGVGRVPLPARHDRSGRGRNINLGLNPLFCPLPDWADEVHATCRQAEIKAFRRRTDVGWRDARDGDGE